MKTRKAINILLIVLAAFALFVSCGKKEEAAASTGAAGTKEEVVNLSFLCNEAAVSETALKYYEDVIARFESANPNIKVELLQGGDWKDVDAKLNAALVSNTFPDLVLLPLGGYSARAYAGDFKDLTPYINAWDQKDDIYQASLDIGKTADGVYGIGVFPAPEVWMYRKDYFAEAGLDPEMPPKTWDDLYEYAKKLTVKDETGRTIRGGVDIPLADGNLTLFEVFLRQGGNTVVDGTDIIFNEESGVKAMEFLKKFIDEGLTLPYRRGTDDPIYSGKSAMGIVYQDAVKKIIKDDPSMKDKIGFFAALKGEEEASFNGYRLMCISSYTKHADEAWKFVDFFYSAENMWGRYDLLGNPPVRKSLAEKYLAADPYNNQVILDSMKVGHGRPVVPFVNIMSKYEKQAYEEIMNGAKSAQQALDDAKAATYSELGR